MVTNILLRLHVDLVEKDSYSNTTETFAHVIAWLKLGNVNNGSHFRLSITSRQLLANMLPTHCRQAAYSRMTVGQQLADSRSTNRQQSADSWPTDYGQYLLGAFLHFNQ